MNHITIFMDTIDVNFTCFVCVHLLHYVSEGQFRNVSTVHRKRFKHLVPKTPGQLMLNSGTGGRSLCERSSNSSTLYVFQKLIKFNIADRNYSDACPIAGGGNLSPLRQYILNPFKKIAPTKIKNKNIKTRNDILEGSVAEALALQGPIHRAPKKMPACADRSEGGFSREAAQIPELGSEPPLSIQEAFGVCNFHASACVTWRSSECAKISQASRILGSPKCSAGAPHAPKIRDYFKKTFKAIAPRVGLFLSIGIALSIPTRPCLQCPVYSNRLPCLHCPVFCDPV